MPVTNKVGKHNAYNTSSDSNTTKQLISFLIYGPKKLESLEFYQYSLITLKGWVPCTILTKFTGFMRALRLYNIAKFDCYISINKRKKLLSLKGCVRTTLVKSHNKNSKNQKGGITQHHIA